MKASLPVFLSVLLGTQLSGADLLSPGDFIIPIDDDSIIVSSSNYPAAESPAMAIDGDVNTKYLNFAKENSGFIVTPSSGPAAVQSIRFTSANDFEDRDPAAFALYGTDDPIFSADNSLGDGETWLQVASGAVALPPDRLTAAPIVNFVNATAYTSYRLVITGVKNAGTANSMQIADVQFFTEADGAGSAVLAAGDPIIAVHLGSSDSSSPAAEQAFNAIDGDVNTKYLNFGKENSGFIVTPGIGASIVSGVTLISADDAEPRDPVDWELFGTNEAILSGEHSTGNAEAWTSIGNGSAGLPPDRFTTGPTVNIANAASYTSYKFIVRSVKDSPNADSMQFAEIQFAGQLGVGTPLAITNILYDEANAMVTVTWASEQGRSYILWYSPDLINWGTDVNDSIFGESGTTSWGPFPDPGLVLPEHPGRGFFRVEATSVID